MSSIEFELFTKLMKQKKSPTKPPPSPISLCKHTIIIEHGASLCIDCGLEIDHNIPNRCYVRKVKDRTIYSDVEHMNISKHIKDIANNIYTDACGVKVRRGSIRRGIVFASIFYAYKLDHNPQNCENLIQIFKIKRKDALRGLKFISEHSPSNAPLRTIYITPEHIIGEFMVKFNATLDQKTEVVQLYRSLIGKSSMLNRSRPQSVAAGVIYYYTLVNGKQISIKSFIQKVKLSELTVNKISKEVARILGNDDFS
jgi:transcription initiation factor TFIIIB Brf1 subunit/transcription initiation factor TFIIB